MFYHRRLAFVVLLFGLGLAAVAAIQARSMLDAAYASTTVVQEVPTVEVVVFKADLPRGHVVTPDDLLSVPFVAASTPDTFVRDQNSVVGSYIVVDIARGQPAVASLLSHEPIEQRPISVRERRAGAVTSVCIARCPEPKS